MYREKSAPPVKCAKKKDDSDKGQVIVNEFTEHHEAHQCAVHGYGTWTLLLRRDDDDENQKKLKREKMSTINDARHTRRRFSALTPKIKANGTPNRLQFHRQFYGV